LTITDYRPSEGDALQWTGNAQFVSLQANADGLGYTLTFGGDAGLIG